MLQQQAAEVSRLDVVRLEAEVIGSLADRDDDLVAQLAGRDERPPLDGEAPVVPEEGGLLEVAERLVPVVGVGPALRLERAVDREDPALGAEPAVVPIVAARAVDHLVLVAVLRREEAIAESGEQRRVYGL